jgi:hypothetical protein
MQSLFEKGHYKVENILAVNLCHGIKGSKALGACFELEILLFFLDISDDQQQWS